MSESDKSLTGIVQELMKKMQNEVLEMQEPNQGNCSALEQMGYERLKGMDEFIEMIDATIAGHMALKASIVNKRNKLLEEIHQRFGVKEPEQTGTTSNGSGTMGPAWLNEKIDGNNQ